MDFNAPSMPDILLISLIGFATVFAVLVVLMCLIVLISKIFGQKNKPQPAAPAASADVPVKEDTYTGVKLNGVSERDAALIMAIVADEIGKPMEHLRFVSIKEVK